VRDVTEFVAEANQKSTAFLEPKMGLVPTLAAPHQLAHPLFEPDDSRKEGTKEPTRPRSMHERNEKLVPGF
jgi:hypothetical protein